MYTDRHLHASAVENAVLSDKKIHPQTMILQGNPITLSAPLELDFKIPFPTLNIQLVLTLRLAIAFKKNFISCFGPDIKNLITI